LSVAYGCPGAEAEHREGAGYTGRVILSPQAVTQIIADWERIAELEEHLRRVTGAAAESVRHDPRALAAPAEEASLPARGLLAALAGTFARRALRSPGS